MAKSSYDRIRSPAALWRAWSHVYQSAALSESDETRRAVATFKQGERANIERIARQLRKGTFSFGGAKGKPIPRPGKSPRPIVVATIEARVVQRAILEELTGLPPLKPFFESQHSYGGVVGRNREDAIREVQKELAHAKFYIRSDISDFFTKIPRPRALEVLQAPLDEKAAQLLDDATHLDLANASSIRRHIHLFPTPEQGAAQGLCLSPLMGNVVLHDFDRAMNAAEVRCIRYVDDFIVLATTEDDAWRAFDQGLLILHGLGMTAYDPRTEKKKSQAGSTASAIDFLGCTVERGRIQPNRKARQRIVERVRERLVASRLLLGNAEQAYDQKETLSRTLYDVGNTVRGWKDAYAFCNGMEVFELVDSEIDELLQSYLDQVRAAMSRGTPRDRRHLLGVVPLAPARPAALRAGGNLSSRHIA
jgi:retron-type reverse transcriptase